MWSRAQRARGVGRAPKVGESITSPMHAIDLMGRVTWIRAARSQKLSCRCFAVLCALILIFDVLGGLTDLWKHEFARKQTARVRLGVSLLACVSQLILEVHNACGLSWLRSDPSPCHPVPPGSSFGRIDRTYDCRWVDRRIGRCCCATAALRSRMDLRRGVHRRAHPAMHSLVFLRLRILLGL